uniref:SGNH hydrolase-type esterase domain-containing protein n=1 Tax=Magallana gigas TaxID=29159 RepID=A0A8W8JAM3_MAGGI
MGNTTVLPQDDEQVDTRQPSFHLKRIGLCITSPDIVVVCLGGNDLSSGAETSTVIDCLTSLFHRIRDFAPRQPNIFFTEIVSRGKFRSSLQREEFDGKRRTVNNKMKKILGRTFIRIDVRFPRHYLPDEIHFNDAGTVIFLLSISKTVKSRSLE